MNVIKKSIEFIAQPFIHIINCSLLSGIYPDLSKLAKVIPVFKANDPENFSNYRLISLLTNFSKIFEKVMHNHITDFVNQFEILYPLQFGFRKNHSTVSSLIYMINKIATSIDRNQITVGIFLDLSKAFDTIDHQILFSKLEHYGIRGIALQWSKSYFHNRKQFVQFNETRSTECVIKCGVSQGSILDLLFFLLYINDLPNAAKLAEYLLFVDDTSIFLSHSDLSYLISTMNVALEKINVWMKTNKLSVNIGKTNYIIFKPKQKSIAMNMLVIFDKNSLNRVNVVKFLGIFIDENISLKHHIDHVCNKISKSIGVISRSSFVLSMRTKLSLYYTLIYPYISYCNLVWSSTYATSLNRIWLLQKRAVRVITNSPYRSHSAPLFEKLKVLDIFKINAFHIARFMFLYHHRFLPESLSNLFVSNNQVHSYYRNLSCYRSHSCRKNIKQFTILYQGPKIWKSLPHIIKSNNSLKLFKTFLRIFLLNE